MVKDYNFSFWGESKGSRTLVLRYIITRIYCESYRVIDILRYLCSVLLFPASTTPSLIC